MGKLLEIAQPSPAALKWFGVPVAVFFAVVGALAWLGGAALFVDVAIWTAGALLLAVYQAVPAWRRRIYLGWMYAFHPLGLVTSTIVLAAVYYLVVTPIALVLRLTRRDPLERKFDPNAHSYWQARERRRDPASYFRQF